MSVVEMEQGDRRLDAEPRPFAYDALPYPGFPFNQTHPRRLATLAWLHDMQPAPPARCRVLELGCGKGGNLVPMACQYPDSRFLGVDLSTTAIEEGQQSIARLGLRNIELRRLDITQLSPDDGQFDYIIAHGVYSWVPPHVRAKMLSIFRRNLAPQGVAYVSYNCHPGSYLRDLCRSMMLYHVRDTIEPKQRVEQGRMLLQVLSQTSNDKDVYGLVLRSQFERVRKSQDAVLHHDDLDADATAFFFHQVVEDAAREGLQYLSDASAPVLSGTLVELPDGSEAVVKFLEQIDDWATREQYLDFVKGRMFRETLLCHQGLELRRPVAASRIRDLQLCTELRVTAGDADPQAAGPTEFKTRMGLRLSTDHRLSKAALLHLGAIWPQSIGFADLVNGALARLGPAADAVRENLDEELETLTKVLFRAFCSGLIDGDVHPPGLTGSISDRPAVSALARMQAETGTLLTNLQHCAVVLDSPITQRLVTLLDGTRTTEQLTADLLAALPEITQGNAEKAEGQPVISRENIEHNVKLLAQLALLVA